MEQLYPILAIVTVLCLLAITSLTAFNNFRTRRELQQVNVNLRHQALRDELTGLWNRRALFDRLDEVLPMLEDRSISILMLDLDHFKEVNDKHGHTAGDDILEHVAALLRRSVRRVDFVARYGGEEFHIILMDADGIYAEHLAERICREVAEHRDREHIDIPVTVSIGVVDMRGVTDKTPRGIMESVDRALYMAKSSGRNRVFRGDRYASVMPPNPKLPTRTKG